MKSPSVDECVDAALLRIRSEDVDVDEVSFAFLWQCHKYIYQYEDLSVAIEEQDMNAVHAILRSEMNVRAKTTFHLSAHKMLKGLDQIVQAHEQKVH